MRAFHHCCFIVSVLSIAVIDSLYSCGYCGKYLVWYGVEPLRNGFYR